MKQTPLPLLPLELLIERLRGAGISIDPARRLRLLRVFDRESGKLVGDPEVFHKLKLLLTPFLARTAKEQEAVYGVFEKLEKEWKDEHDQALKAWQDPTTPTQTTATNKTKFRWQVWLIALLLLGATGYAILMAYARWKENNQFGPPVAYLVVPDLIRAADSLRFENGGWIVLNGNTGGGAGGGLSSSKSRPIQNYYWQVIHEDKHQLDAEGHDSIFYWKAPEHGVNLKIRLTASNDDGVFADSTSFRIHCSNPPQLAPKFPRGPFTEGQTLSFETKLEKDAEAEWIFDDADTLNGRKVNRKFETTGSYSVRLNVWRKNFKDDCYDTRDTTITVGSSKPYLATYALKKDEPGVILQLKTIWWLLALLPFLPALFFLWRWWEARQKSAPERTVADIEADHPIHHTGPYYIPYLPQESKITVPRDFFRIAEILSRREAGLRRNFDVPATLNATVEAGGFPSWRETPQTRPTEYLLLITRPNERHQAGRLFERLAAFLKKRDVPMETWFHDGRFERCWNPDHPDGLSLTELNRRLPQHRLVLLGDAHGLIDSADTTLPALRADLVTALRRWARRLLLTPEPVSGWQFQEKLLHKLFLIFPADTEGILSGFDLLDWTEEYDPGSYDRWEALLQTTHREPTHRYINWKSAQEHFAYLDAVDAAHGHVEGKSLKEWLCALAVSPQPDWALTIALGRAIGAEVTHDRLLALTRIPWLGANKQDIALRLELLNHLSEADEKIARETFARELEAVREQTQNGFAEAERRAHAAVQQFALDPFNPEHQKLLGDLKKIGLLTGSHQAEVQHIFENKVTPVLKPHQTEVFEWIERPAEKPVWTMNLMLAIFCGVLGMALTLACSMVDRQALTRGVVTSMTENETVWFKSKPYNDEAIRLNNEGVRLWEEIDSLKRELLVEPEARELRVLKILERADRADSLFQAADSIRVLDILIGYLLARQNKQMGQFNRAAYNFNCYLDGLLNGDSLEQIQTAFAVLFTDTKFDKLEAAGRDAQQIREALERNNLNINTSYMSAGDVQLNARHGRGLTAFYLKQYPQAVSNYKSLLELTDSLYFDTLRANMPVNLQTLLQGQGLIGNLSYWLSVLVIDQQRNRPEARIQVLLDGKENLRTDGGGRARRQVSLPAGAPTRVRARVNNADYKPWSGWLLYRSNPDIPDTIYLAPKEQERPIIDQPVEEEPRSVDPPVTLPDKSYFTKTLEGFQYDDSLYAHIDEAVRMINTLDVKDPITVRGLQEPYTVGVTSSGYSITIWASPKGNRNRYALRFGLPDMAYLKNDASYLEFIRPERKVPKPPPSLTPIFPEMVLVPGGRFMMGSTKKDKNADKNEMPQHPVTLPDYYIGKYEVTNEEFVVFLNDEGKKIKGVGGWIDLDNSMKAGGSHIYKEDGPGGYFFVEAGYEKYPVSQVSWYGAEAYCTWLSSNSKGLKYRLPSESEWEYAARGGPKWAVDKFIYSGSNNLDEVGWYIGNSGGREHERGTLKANQLGIYDMSGNMYEWCEDTWHDDYRGAPDNGAAWVNKSSPTRVCRGGSWYSYDIYCRSAYRYIIDPANRSSDLGFRVAQDK